MINITYAVVTATLLLSTPALAIDDNDRAAIKTTFETLTTGIAEGDYGAVFSTMSPAILAKMAEPTGLDAEAFREIAATQMKAAMSQVEIKEVSFNLDDMVHGTSATGRDYAVIDTVTRMTMAENNIKATGPALAYEDGDKWYVLQIQSPDQAAVLAAVYPDLAEVEASRGFNGDGRVIKVSWRIGCAARKISAPFS